MPAETAGLAFSHQESYNAIKSIPYVVNRRSVVMNTARVQAHIDKPLKEQGEQILKELGISTAELIRMTFRQLVKKQGIPFERIPNAETLQSFEEAEDPSQVTRYGSARDAVSDMWNES